MICVYAPNCTDFSNNGLGAVRPQSCTVTETLNGEWELTLVHPIDELGKWQRLTDGCILRASVPAAMTPQIDLVTQQYQTTTYDVEIYKVSTSGGPLRLRSGTGTNYKILGKYKKGMEVIVLAKTTSSWYEVTCPDGKHGYMSSEYLTYVRTEQESVKTNVGFSNSTIEPRQLRDQPFRIYRVVPELNRITVYARHIFYDLLDNMVKSVKPTADAVGASVVQSISEGCLSEHDFTFYSDLETTATDVSFENINPVEALLGEEGLTGKYGAELVRDWYDVFLVSRVGNNSNVQIREKKNLTGISFDVDETDVVTRIMPTGEDADGNLLYLPELYIDSPNIGAYPHPKWIHLPVSDAKEVTEGDETKSKDECYKAMRDAVQAEYDAGCDLPTVTLKVDFVNCKDTEEYRQFAALTNIFLGDSVRVIARRIGIEVTMRMTQYTYDCLTRKYTSVTLGTAAETLEGTTISSRQLASGSITGMKLALNSIGSGHLQNGSVGSLQVKNAAIQSAHIQNAAITRAHIAEALIETLNVNALNAVTARIQELAAGQITTDELYASIAMIATAQLTTANIVQANIQWAQIQTLATEIAAISKTQINTASINSANIDWAAITTLTAAVSTMIKADIGTADIDWSHIKDLATDTAIITQGTAGQLYITRLAVTEANMVSLTVGELVVKGSDGHFYAMGVDKNGNVVTTLKQVVNDDVADLSIHGTEKLIEGSITAKTLNVQEIFGDNATIRSLIAANIDVDTLFAREATLNAINAMDITGNTYLKLMVSKKADQTTVDALSERMAAAELKITADAIVSTVRSSSSYTTDLAGKASTSAVATAQSAADKAQTTANSAQTAANSAQNTIDSLDIGGRNLLKNSASRPILSSSDHSSASQREAGMITTLLETQGNAHNWVQNSLAKTPAEITESIGAEYSFSVDVKVTGSFTDLCASFDVRPAETHSYQLICTAYHDGTTYDQWIRLKATGTVKGTDGARALIGMRWSSSTAGSTIEYRNFKVEAGNRATDWTPAPEDVEAGIADAQSAADNAQSTADNAQSAADNAQSTADNAQNAANTNARNIATLVTRMTSAEQKITADAIVSTVTKSETYTTDLAAVQSAASGAQSSADKAQSDIDSLQIGGRNLLPDSKGDFVLTPKNTGAAGDNFNYYRFYCDMTLNETYTISADIEVTAGEYDSVSIYPYPGGSSAKAVIPENGRVVCTFTKTVDTIDSVLIYAGLSGATRGNGAIIRNVKIEKGNRATDWTPAPEDVDAGIADEQSAASSAQESADKAQGSADSAQSAADKAQSTANTNASNIATLTTRMTSAEQKITADAIVSTVRSSTAYTTDLAGKASTSAVATAQSTADSAKTAASTAQSAADKAQTTANSAQSAASAAQSTANSAQSAASAAQSTANSAQTAASTAQSSANSAKSAADAAQITADTAQTTADAAQSSIDSLDIGGRNLLMNSASRPILSSSDFSSASQRETGKITTLLETQGNAYNWVQSSLAKTPAEITESIGAEYSFSVDVKITGSVTDLYATLDVRPADTHTKRLAIAAYHDRATYDQWIRLKGTGAVAGTDGARSLICITWSGSTVGSTIEYRNFKVEAGNRATDWTPAPEDVDAGIADAQSAAENAQSTADNAQSTADKAQSTANTNASNITALTTRVTTAEQKITADAIVSTVRSSTAYTTDLAGKASTSAVATAQSTADKAQTTATSAQTTANTAKTTADSAKTTATSAQTTANQNATNITNLTTRVSNAESSITQNANNIALKVSTSTYNAEKVYRGSSAPTTLYTNMLWLDTSVTPNLLKRYTGSAWVVAGAQEVKSSGIYIGSNQVSITTEDFLLQLLDPSDNENVLMEMSADGNVGFKELYADEIISDSVAQAYSGSNYLWVVPSITTPTETDFRSLGEAVQAVNNRHLKEDVYIYLPYGSETYEPGGVTISGIFGSGRLVIYGYGENSILNSYIKVKGCFSNVCFQNVHLRESRSLNGSNRQPYLVEVQQCHFVEFNGCTLDANSITYDSVYARASHVFLYNCGLYNALQGLECYLATGNVKNCCGSCSWSMISYASIIFASGTVPAGSRGTGENGQLYATSVTVDYGTAIPTVTPDENGILYASTTRSWRGSWRTDTLDVIQGVYSDSGYSSSLNWHRGCMWFSTAKSLLSGCTVKSATLTLRRETGSGSGSAKTVYLCAITNTSASGTPSIAKNYGALGTIGRGKQVTFAIPVDAVQGLADGTYGGLCLYETPYNFGSSTYSNCYMRMNGTDTDYEPYIECVYSGSTGNG